MAEARRAGSRAPRSSRALPGANETWPPSVGSAVQPALPGTSAETPRPVPAPAPRPRAPASRRRRRSARARAAARCGMASAWAAKSLITASRRRPSRACRPAIENVQGLLVKLDHVASRPASRRRSPPRRPAGRRDRPRSRRRGPGSRAPADAARLRPRLPRFDQGERALVPPISAISLVICSTSAAVDSLRPYQSCPPRMQAASAWATTFAAALRGVASAMALCYKQDAQLMVTCHDG